MQRASLSRSGLRVALLATLLIAAAAVPAEAAKRFRAYVSCGISDSTFTTPSHSCPVGDLPQAVIVNRKRASVRYRLCVQVPSGATYCATHRARGDGRLNQRALGNEALGQHVISWYVGGRLIGRWTLVRTIGD